MKINTWIICGIALLASACGGAGGVSSVGSLNNHQDSLSYALGLNIGTSLKMELVDNGLELSEEVIAQGLMDVIKESDRLLDEGSIQPLMMRMQKDLSASRQEMMMQQAETNKAEGDAFFTENKTKDGVIETESGLQYKILASGKGTSPQSGQTVVVHYTGKLLDGTIFDSSIQRGTPAEFRVDQVIAGWTEALQLMVPGDRWELYIPSNLGYGAQGSPPNIGPYAALIFEVELLEAK
ncbi:MAG: FKBP-type peptidyl-prolyl cis-trans isomerase [Bacteroidota bacterium]